MPWQHILWDDEPGGNVDKVAQHGQTPDDVSFVLQNPDSRGTSRSSGRPLVRGETPDGREITVIYEDIDGVTLFPITAYENG